MNKSRILGASLIASTVAMAPISSALAGGPHWSHGASHYAPTYHAGYRGPYWHGGGSWHGGGGYWHGGVWWPAAAAVAVVGTAAALVAAPFVAIGNAVASSAYVPPPAPYYTPQQYYPSQGYNAPQQQYYAPSYGNAPQYDPSVPSDYYAQPAPQQQYYNRAASTRLRSADPGLLRAAGNVQRADELSAREQYLLSSEQRRTGVLHLLLRPLSAMQFVALRALVGQKMSAWTRRRFPPPRGAEFLIG